MHMNPDSTKLMRQVKYRFLVTRDFLLILLVTQLIIGSLAWFLHGIDTSGCPGHTWGISSHPHPETCDESALVNGTMADGTTLVCGELRKTLLCWCGIAPHDKTSYYIMGMVIFFALIGFFGLAMGMGQSAGCCNCAGAEDDCYWCIWCDCHYTRHHAGDQCNCNGCCSGCDCNSCDCNCNGGGDNCGAVVLVLVAVVCVILALVGVLIAAFALAAAIQTIMQRHMHILQKRQFSRAFLVADLDGVDTGAMPRSYEPPPYDMSEDAAIMLQDQEAPPPYSPPMPNAPPMSKAEMDELYSAGLM